jgi:hypothetical protein
MSATLETALFWAGPAQLCVLFASALVPLRLRWTTVVAELPPLVRQLFWIYGGYVVLSIVALGVICTVNAGELSEGGILARSFCAYGALFWGVRLSLQPFLKVGPYLSRWWLRTGYHVLTLLFAGFTLVFAWGVVH